MIVDWEILERRGICFKPSTAEVTEMGGVIIPSANNAAPPRLAGINSHLPLLLTRAYKENIPPSPRLSAFNVRITYFTVVCKVSVQMMRDKEPMTNSLVIVLPLTIE